MEIAIKAEKVELARWVELSRSGDTEAQRRLVDEIGGLVRATARRSVRDPDDAEDLTQNIFLAMGDLPCKNRRLPEDPGLVRARCGRWNSPFPYLGI